MFFCSYATLEPYPCLFSVDFDLKRLDLQALWQLGLLSIVMALLNSSISVSSRCNKIGGHLVEIKGILDYYQSVKKIDAL
jgi:hypothetical protein